MGVRWKSEADTRRPGHSSFVGSRTKTGLAYRSAADEAPDPDQWMRIRDEEALSPERLVRLAKAAHASNGFTGVEL